MKKAGWVLTILGCISLLGCLSAGNSPFGPLFWIGLGIYLIHRANQKIKDKQDKEKWNTENKDNKLDEKE